MAFSEIRAQLLANVRCLYGSGAEVLTLRVDNYNGQHQAIAVTFDPLTSTWTKYLHSDLRPSATDTFHSLLIESERELTNFLSSNGHVVPFQGSMMHTISLPHGQPYHSCTTLASTLPDAFGGDILHVDHSAEVIASSPLVDQRPVNDADADDKNSAINEIRRDDFSVRDCPVEEYPAESPDEAPVIENTVEEFQSVEPLEEVALELAEDDDWGSFLPTKKKKKRGITSMEEYPPPEEVAPEPLVDDGWGSFPTKKDKKKKRIPAIEEHPHPEEISSISAEVAPEPIVDDGWGSFLTKKDKKKKRITTIEEHPLLEEVSSISVEVTLEPIVDDGWGSFSLAKKKKKKGITSMEECPPPEEVAIEPAKDFGWGSSSTTKKKNKKDHADQDVLSTSKEKTIETLTEEERRASPDFEPISNLVEECEENNLENLPTVPVIALHSPPESGPGSKDISSGHITFEAELPPKLVARRCEAIVFMIQFPNEMSVNPLQVMTTIAENTRTAILDSVNSYLSSKGMLIGNMGQRKIVIRSAVGRSGNLDVSTLEDTKWPEYLEYFRQYTKIPELMVDVTD
ncbi:hypothetical protein VTL71DRAFT_14916 [Oculimacula yallundae]|uniref:Uncharacterized protein n=1 Tax=Oculimacula yallundae TaxID=86028 RepID=A0ABR4CF44_9HELO